MSKPTQSRLKELLQYDPESGVFTWRIARKKCLAGSTAGTLSIDHLRIGVDLRQFAAHHLAWLYMTGEWPLGCVTHINGDGFDNRWSNLRMTKRAKLKAHELTQKLLMSELAYDENTGVFTWCRIAGTAFGQVAGSTNDQGYLLINVFGRPYRAHRLAWIYVHGSMPEQEIDHINRDRADNRIANLRLANSSQNKQNTPLRCDNTSGFRGVVKKRGKWQAQIGINTKVIRLGVYSNPAEASGAYKDAAAALHTHNPLEP